MLSQEISVTDEQVNKKPMSVSAVLKHMRANVLANDTSVCNYPVGIQLLTSGKWLLVFSLTCGETFITLGQLRAYYQHNWVI